MSISQINTLSTQSSSSAGSTQLSTEQAAAKTLALLIKDVQSGNVSAATKDLATLTKQIGPVPAADASSPLGTLLTALGSDLSSGNLASAQTDVQSFLSTLQSPQPVASTVPHHRRHSAETDSTYTATTSSVSSAVASQYPDPLLNAVEADLGLTSANSSRGTVNA